MPEVRYAVPGVPPGAAKGITAFTPGLTRSAAGGAVSYKYALTGSPGTAPVPVDTSNIPAGGAVGQAQMGTARSSDAPGAFWPQLYYQHTAVERSAGGQPIQVYDPVRPGLTSLLPVPAVTMSPYLQANSAKLSRAAVLQRIRQLPWFPRVYKAPSA